MTLTQISAHIFGAIWILIMAFWFVYFVILLVKDIRRKIK